MIRCRLEYVSYELGNWACTCGKLTGIENRYHGVVLHVKNLIVHV